MAPYFYKMFLHVIYPQKGPMRWHYFPPISELKTPNLRGSSNKHKTQKQVKTSEPNKWTCFQISAISSLYIFVRAN